MDRQAKNYYQGYNRGLTPSQRANKAVLKMWQALALLEDEITMQNAYASMDYSSLKTGHYKWAVKLLNAAMEAMQKEQDEYVYKTVHKEWRTEEK